MSADGLFRVSVAQQPSIDVYNLTYQALPWFETTFRYTVFNPGEFDRSREDLRDRSYALKFRLLKEGRYVPAVALGLQDALGTGVLGAEYLVANKRFGNLDASLGIGWGRLATRSIAGNPFGVIDERFDVRDEFEEGEQGQPLTGTFFRGRDVGVFGGLRYDVPRWNLSLLAEYSSDDYSREAALGTISDASPYNFGVTWSPAENLDLTVSRQLGQEWGLRISAALDTKGTRPPKRSEGFWSASEPASRSRPPEGLDLSSWYARLLYDVERSGLLLRAAELTDDDRVVWLEVSNDEYQYAADAIRRILSFAELHLPRQIHTVNLVLVEQGLRHAAISYRRSAGRVDLSSITSADTLIDVIPPRALVEPRYRTGYQVPRVSFAANIGTRFQVMDPDDPLRYQALLRVGARARLGRGFAINGLFAIDLYNDFDDIDRGSNSVLPRVRSDVSEYLRQGDSGVDALYLEYRGSYLNGVHLRGYAGVLEEMYSGAGAEVLWQPFGSRLAFGATLNYLHQRDFDKDFGLRKYETVTGFVSAYWATPFEGYDVALHAGRYLARDVGATVEIRRTFANGWSLGAWATLTDVPFDEFGEGSFDKGLFLRVPFNDLLPGNSRGSYTTALRAVQRDGGQRTEGFGSTLWWDLRATRTDTLVEHKSRMRPR